jgi:hypothetical protein
MGARKTQFELDQIMAEHNVSRIWSWSRYTTSKADLYGYYLKYIMGVKPDQIPSIYGSLGGHVHDLVEQMYKGSITKDEVVDLYNDKAVDLEITGQQFSRADDELNDKIGGKYHYCNIHFFKNCSLRRGENEQLEQFITIKVGRQLFIGYVDYMYEKDDCLWIEDFKTSSMYSKKKQEENAGQLRLYALGMHQAGWDISKIKAGWVFIKYVDIDIKNKNGNIRTTTCLRSDIGSKLANSIKSWMSDKKECKANAVDYADADIEFAMQLTIDTNDITHLPKHIQDKFTIKDCFVETEITKEVLDELQKEISEHLAHVVSLEYRYDRDKNDDVFCIPVTQENEFFFANLSDYSIKYHKPYREYVENKNMFREEEDEDDIESLMKELGL